MPILLVVLNDNAMGIDPSVGALKKYLTNVKTGTQKEENIFEALILIIRVQLMVITYHD